MAEETGYQAGHWQRLHEFWVSPGILNERMHLFLATGLRPGPAALEVGEQIHTLLLPWAEALALIDAGQIRDAKTLAGLLFYDRIRRENQTAG